jgi:hypothetical protein
MGLSFRGFVLGLLEAFSQHVAHKAHGAEDASARTELFDGLKLIDGVAEELDKWLVRMKRRAGARLRH